LKTVAINLDRVADRSFDGVTAAIDDRLDRLDLNTRLGGLGKGHPA